jgi:exoribonuclease R
MRPAAYLAAGDLTQPAAWRHYALNIPHYTHFNSPIRRCADVAVHRMLDASLLGQSAVTGINGRNSGQTAMAAQWSPGKEQATTARCSEIKNADKAAQERSGFLSLCVYFKSFPM